MKTGRATRRPHASARDREPRSAGACHPAGLGCRDGIPSQHDSTAVRLTQYAHGGGCACKIPPGELEQIVAGLGPDGPGRADLLVGLDTGDDAAVVRVGDGTAMVVTADFFTPVVDDAYDWGRIAAANALSDVYAMGGRPLVAVNLVGWPRDVLPAELLREVLRGGLDVGARGGLPRRAAGTASTTRSPSTAWP